MTTIKNTDINAILEYYPANHIYLKIVGKGDDRHLEAVKVNWLGRFWMWVGFSNASIQKIATYFANLDAFNVDQIAKEKAQKPEEVQAITDKFLRLKTRFFNIHRTDAEQVFTNIYGKNDVVGGEDSIIAV